MAQRYLQRQTKLDNVEAVPDSAHPVVVVAPRAIVRGPDGTATWVARCPRCSDRHDESIVTGYAGALRASCATCGVIVEVRESGVFPTSPTVPPPKE